MEILLLSQIASFMGEVSTYSTYVVQLHVRVNALVSACFKICSVVCTIIYVYLLFVASRGKFTRVLLDKPWGRYLAGKKSVMS